MADESGNTALHKAAQCSLSSACRLLIGNGADPSIKNCDGHTPADLAPVPVAKVITEEPVKANADIESRLLEAAKNGDLETVKVHCMYMYMTTCVRTCMIQKSGIIIVVHWDHLQRLVEGLELELVTVTCT